MKTLLHIASRSAWNRRLTLSLTVLSIALSTLLLTGVERIRTELRAHFSAAVSGTDLIVGARSGSTQLLLYSVFRIGSATQNMDWRSVEALQAHPAVAWVAPLSLGDSHRGFPVLATSAAYYQHFRWGQQQPLALTQGSAPQDDQAEQLFHAVLGADVAEQLGYRLGQSIALTHGESEFDEVHEPDHPPAGPTAAAAAGLAQRHDDKPFTVSGILARTGTPVDRTVHISLPAMQALHLEWVGGAPMPGVRLSAEQVRKFDLSPKEVTAALVGLKSRAAVFALQRWVSRYPGEPLMGILPGVALDELWQVIGTGEKALLAVSTLVALVSLAGLVAVVLAGLNERRRELAVLRAVGAGARHVLALLALEGALVTVLGVLLGLVGAALGLILLGPWAQTRWGLGLTLSLPTLNEAILLGALLTAGWLASLLPGLRAYRLSLADGLSPKI